MRWLNGWTRSVCHAINVMESRGIGPSLDYAGPSFRLGSLSSGVMEDREAYSRQEATGARLRLAEDRDRRLSRLTRLSNSFVWIKKSQSN